MRSSIMPGNHDAWLCPFYERELRRAIVPDPVRPHVYGLRLHVVHGHLLGRQAGLEVVDGKPRVLLELRPHSRCRSPVLLDRDSDLEQRPQARSSDEERHLRVFRVYASRLEGLADLVVIGHVHRAVDESRAEPRMIVLGGWQARSSFLKVDRNRGELSRRSTIADRPAMRHDSRPLRP